MAKKYTGIFEEQILQDTILFDAKNSFLLKAIHTYMLMDFEQTRALINQIHELKKISFDDTLFNIKLNLLEARLHFEMGNDQTAKLYYQKLDYYIEEGNLLREEINRFLNVK